VLEAARLVELLVPRLPAPDLGDPT
jgi:hypothetical protein